MMTYGGVDAQIHVFLTSPLAGCESSASRPGRFTPRGDPRYPLERTLSGQQNRSGLREEEKILDPTGTRIPTPLVQPVASRYADCAISAPM
jgi:hypothetical protein